jgi:TRAP-type C4-dicarboxylate transport system permease small subunit
MNWLIKTERFITRLLTGYIVVCFFSILAIVISLVILRYGFNTTIVGGNELVVILFIYTSAIGAAIVVGKREHIAITYFIDRLPYPFKKAVDILDYILIAFINGVMIIYSIQWISKTGSYSYAVLGIPQVVAQIIIPIGSGLAILYCLYLILLSLKSKTREVDLQN